MRDDDRVILGYNFPPIPERAVQALAGRLSHTDFAIIGFLYERARLGQLVHGKPSVKLTLDQIAAGIGWRKSPNALSQRLRRLRDQPEKWVTWETVERDYYSFTLYPHPPALVRGLDGAETQQQSAITDYPEVSDVRGPIVSEVCPRSEPNLVRDPDAPESQQQTAIARAGADGVVRGDFDAASESVRDSWWDGRDPEGVEPGTVEPETARAEKEHVRGAQTSQTPSGEPYGSPERGVAGEKTVGSPAPSQAALTDEPDAELPTAGDDPGVAPELRDEQFIAAVVAEMGRRHTERLTVEIVDAVASQLYGGHTAYSRQVRNELTEVDLPPTVDAHETAARLAPVTRTAA